MLEKVIQRLLQLGYKTTDIDNSTIEYCIGSVEQYIKNFCNITKIPQEMEYIECDMVCGEFLLFKRATGQLNVEQIVSSVNLGDMSVSFGGMSNTECMDLIISNLKNKDGELICFRTLRW